MRKTFFVALAIALVVSAAPAFARTQDADTPELRMQSISGEVRDLMSQQRGGEPFDAQFFAARVESALWAHVEHILNASRTGDNTFVAAKDLETLLATIKLDLTQAGYGDSDLAQLDSLVSEWAQLITAGREPVVINAAAGSQERAR